MKYNTGVPFNKERHMHILINEKRYRDLAIALLDDDHGITEGAYHILIELMPDELYDQIVLKVRTTEGRVYLPERSVKNVG